MNTKILPIISSIVIAGLIIFLFLTFAVKTSVTQGNGRALDDPVLLSLKNDINETLGDFYDTANTSEKSLSNSETTLSGGYIIFNSITSIWKTMTITPKAVYNIVQDSLISKLGVSPEILIVFGVLSGLLILLIIVAAWRFVSTGDGS